MLELTPYEVAVTGNPKANAELFKHQNQPSHSGRKWISIQLRPVENVSTKQVNTPYKCTVVKNGLEIDQGMIEQIEAMVNAEVSAFWFSGNFAWKGQNPGKAIANTFLAILLGFICIPLCVALCCTIILIPFGLFVLLPFMHACGSADVYNDGPAISSRLMEAAYNNVGPAILRFIATKHPRIVLRPFDMPCDYPLDRGNQPYLAWVVEEDPETEGFTVKAEEYNDQKMNDGNLFVPAPALVAPDATPAPAILAPAPIPAPAPAPTYVPPYVHPEPSANPYASAPQLVQDVPYTEWV